MIQYILLNSITHEELHKTFVEAFSDYQVKMDLPFWKFQQMIHRRGFQPEISIGAFDEERLVGFVLNGLRDWNGKVTAYDIGTGVVGEYRRQKITSEMLFRIKRLLKEKQVEQYLLEVIKPNQSAFELYKKQGFEIQREFSCFQLEKDKFVTKANYKVEQVEGIELEKLEKFWDFTPSWQNSNESIDMNPQAFIYYVVRLDDTIVGYGMVDKMTGDVPQIAVSKEYRHKGIGCSIMTEMVKNTDTHKISVLNVASKPMEDFLIKLGYVCNVGQYEMLIKL